MAAVRLANASKTYENGITAVRNASLEIEDREFVVLVGPSGCGKSTLLRMIAGLEDVTSGDILIDGRRVNDVPPRDRDIAMVFQNYALYPHMTVYDNMAFGLRMRKMPKEEIRARVREAAESLQIAEYLDRKPKALSGGQRQRVALGRAIVRKPKVFLFDEPLSNLDAKLRVQTRIEINRLHKRLRTTMIYVTHDQVEAMTMGDRIVVMSGGVIQQVDTPMKLYDDPANRFVAGFIGSPAMNFVAGKVTAGTPARFTSGTLSLPLAAGTGNRLKKAGREGVTLGIRPEHIGLASASKRVSGASHEVTVDVVEPIGNETMVYVRDGQTQFCVRRNEPVTVKPGMKIRVLFDAKRMLFFDTKSEKRLA
ncbi:MAG: sn-glycerol-3-phosphate ABC transporter ATP-binding protein UgpC [bacterium]|nr:sn-glycerol-3-phosphate ABC transporter ATP-binding protein UgpC [bacterium]